MQTTSPDIHQSIGQKMKNNSLFFCLLAFLMPFGELTYAGTVSIQDQATEFLKTYSLELAAKGFRSEYIIGNIDPRLTLDKCETDYNFSFIREPLEQPQSTLLVTCPDLSAWKMYLSTTYKIFGKVVSSNQFVPRGAIIQASALELIEFQINKINYGSFSDTKYVAGMTAKRAIKANKIITPNLLTPPRLVKRGDLVTIVASNQAISIRMKGTALSHGKMGEQISIRNNQSKRIIKGTVVEAGRVLVAL